LPDLVQTLDGAHNARLGLQFMKEAQKNPELMKDVLKVGLKGTCMTLLE
jgi:hypothetical protein